MKAKTIGEIRKINREKNENALIAKEAAQATKIATVYLMKFKPEVRRRALRAMAVLLG